MAARDPDWLSAFVEREGLGPGFEATVERICRPVAERILAEARRPGYVAGLCGAQGSGKSTVVQVVAALLEAEGRRTAVLSLDDLYLTRAERHALAKRAHPLLATRGPPGTHDCGLGLRTLDALARQGAVDLPRFDKARDDRAPAADWPRAAGPVDVVLFEGWCVGARPQPTEALERPVNDLEREEDPDGTWRRYANDALDGAYRELFARLDLFVLLRAPDFASVLGWRREQEDKLRARIARDGGPGQAMDDAAVARFVAHYERITRWILEEAPARADLCFALDRDRRPL